MYACVSCQESNTLFCDSNKGFFYHLLVIDSAWREKFGRLFIDVIAGKHQMNCHSQVSEMMSSEHNVFEQAG